MIISGWIDVVVQDLTDLKANAVFNVAYDKERERERRGFVMAPMDRQAANDKGEEDVIIMVSHEDGCIRVYANI